MLDLSALLHAPVRGAYDLPHLVHDSRRKEDCQPFPPRHQMPAVFGSGEDQPRGQKISDCPTCERHGTAPRGLAARIRVHLVAATAQRTLDLRGCGAVLQVYEGGKLDLQRRADLREGHR